MKRQTEPKGKAVDLPVNLHSKPDLRLGTLGSDQRSVITNSSGGKELPLRVSELILRDRERSSGIKTRLRVVATPPH